MTTRQAERSGGRVIVLDQMADARVQAGLVSRENRVLDRIERVEWLNAFARWMAGNVGKALKPKPLKNLVSGTWIGHPVHPMLTDVPIGAWTSAAVLDLFGDEWSREAADALIGIGVAAAVPTAITGMSDLSDVTEDGTRSLGAAHAMSNAAAVVLYGAAYLLRRAGRRWSGTALSFLGAGVATFGGFVGGHLAYRKGVGVDQTVFQRVPEEWTAVARDGDLGLKAPMRVVFAGTEVLLLRSGDRIFAIANRCSHRGGSLHEGRVTESSARCPLHGSRFALADGRVLDGPAVAPQPVFETRIRAGQIEIRAAREPAAAPR